MSKSTPEPFEFTTKLGKTTQELIIHRNAQYYHEDSIDKVVLNLTGAQIKQVFKELEEERERIEDLQVILSAVQNRLRSVVLNND